MGRRGWLSAHRRAAACRSGACIVGFRPTSKQLAGCRNDFSYQANRTVLELRYYCVVIVGRKVSIGPLFVHVLVHIPKCLIHIIRAEL